MKKNNKNTFPNFIEEAKKNISEDRATTKTLLMELMKWMHQADERQKEVGMIAAKYLETLQRSNEQLVKLAALKQKTESSDNSISEDEKNEIYDMIVSREHEDDRK